MCVLEPCFLTLHGTPDSYFLPRIRHFSKKCQFWALLETGIRNQYLGSSYICSCWGVILLDTLSWQSKEKHVCYLYSRAPVHDLGLYFYFVLSFCFSIWFTEVLYVSWIITFHNVHLFEFSRNSVKREWEHGWDNSLPHYFNPENGV